MHAGRGSPEGDSLFWNLFQAVWSCVCLTIPLPAILHGITHPLNSSRSFISSRGVGQEVFWDGDPHPTPQEPSRGHGVIQVRSRGPYTPRMDAKQVKYPLIQALGHRNEAKWKWEKGRTSTSCVLLYCVFLQLNEAAWEISAGVGRGWIQGSSMDYLQTDRANAALSSRMKIFQVTISSLSSPFLGWSWDSLPQPLLPEKFPPFRAQNNPTDP